MSNQSKVVALSTTIAATISILAILIGSGIGWGVIQTRVSALEARADTLQETVGECNARKVEKEVYYKDMEHISKDLSEIKLDIRALLNRVKKTTSQ